MSCHEALITSLSLFEFTATYVHKSNDPFDLIYDIKKPYKLIIVTQNKY